MFFKHYYSSGSFYIFVITMEMFMQVCELKAMMIEELSLNNVTSYYILKKKLWTSFLKRFYKYIM